MSTHPPGPVGTRPVTEVRDQPGGRLSRRDVRWLRRRCARRGHVLAFLDDPVSAQLTAPGPDGVLLRCLRCGAFVDPERRAASDELLGSAAEPVPPAEVPQVLRGGHGRKLAVLRLLALERGLRGILLLLAAAGIARLARSHVAVADWLGRTAKAAQPLGNQLGWDVLHSNLLARAEDLLGHSTQTYLTVAWLLAGYGVLELVEGIGLWGGWRWAEYLAVIATSVFIPLEVYELVHRFTVLKSLALLVNVLAVIYLVYKGRLFGIRGGHRAYLVEVREATLLADQLHAAGRPTSVLSGHAVR